MKQRKVTGKRLKVLQRKKKKAYEEWLVINKDNYLKKKILKKKEYTINNTN